MKKVLVTGCNGQLGRAIQKEYAGQVEFILTDVAEGENITSLDITDIDAVMTLALDKKAGCHHQLRSSDQCRRL